MKLPAIWTFCMWSTFVVGRTEFQCLIFSCFFVHWWQFRWTTVQMPPTRMRTCIYTTFELAAALTQPWCSSRESQKSSVSLQHLRQRICHRVKFKDTHIKGQSCMYWMRIKKNSFLFCFRFVDRVFLDFIFSFITIHFSAFSFLSFCSVP